MEELHLERKSCNSACVCVCVLIPRASVPFNSDMLSSPGLQYVHVSEGLRGAAVLHTEEAVPAEWPPLWRPPFPCNWRLTLLPGQQDRTCGVEETPGEWTGQRWLLELLVFLTHIKNSFFRLVFACLALNEHREFFKKNKVFFKLKKLITSVFYTTGRVWVFDCVFMSHNINCGAS